MSCGTRARACPRPDLDRRRRSRILSPRLRTDRPLQPARGTLPQRSSPLCRGALEAISALDHVVHPGHHRLAGIGAKFGHYRNERRPERLKCPLRFPDVENLDLAVRLKGNVVRASFRRARTRSLELGNRFVVLVLGEPAGREVKPKCHSIPDPFRASRAGACQEPRGDSTASRRTSFETASSSSIAAFRSYIIQAAIADLHLHPSSIHATGSRSRSSTSGSSTSPARRS